MKTAKIFLCAALWGVGALFAVSSVSAAEPSAYERAVAEYVEAATEHTKALHEQVKALRPKGAATAGWRTLDESVVMLDQAVRALGKAGAEHFDTLKGRYENERAAVVASIAQLAGA